MSASNKKKILRRLWPALLVFLAALAALELLRPVLRQGGTVPVNDGVGTIYIVPDPALPANTLDSGDFTRQGDAVLYTGSRFTASQGVDVSEWQREIRWQEVADGGIDFAVIRCGYRRYVSGSLEQDTFFEENYSAAGTAGLRRGVYFFSQAVSAAEAREEAAFVLQMLAGRPLELPIFYDWETVTAEEGRANGLDGKTVTACAAAFCRAIEQAGYTAGIYFNLQMGYHTYNLSPLRDYALWIAEPGKYPSFYYHAALWQYDHSGTVPGIDTPADRNLLFEGL
mgnify:FL=1